MEEDKGIIWGRKVRGEGGGRVTQNNLAWDRVTDYWNLLSGDLSRVEVGQCMPWSHVSVSGKPLGTSSYEFPYKNRYLLQLDVEPNLLHTNSCERQYLLLTNNTIDVKQSPLALSQMLKLLKNMSRTYKQSYNPWTRLTRESMRELQKKKARRKAMVDCTVIFEPN